MTPFAAVTSPRTQGPLLVAILCLSMASSVSAAEAEPSGPDGLLALPGAISEDVTDLLAKTRQQYGEDAVVIQTKLLLQVLRNGSRLAAGVRVKGIDDYQGRQYLRFHLETGLVFDDSTRNVEARVHMLWLTVLEPVLESIGEPDLTPTGIAITMDSFHRPYESARELRATIDQPGVSEEIAFYILRDDLAALAHDTLAVRDLFGRARITIDGSERAIVVPPDDAPTLAGPS